MVVVVQVQQRAVHIQQNGIDVMPGQQGHKTSPAVKKISGINNQDRPGTGWVESVASEGSARKKQARTGSLRVVNDPSEPVFDAAISSAAAFKQPV
jgi:hypothetical protein